MKRKSKPEDIPYIEFDLNIVRNDYTTRDVIRILGWKYTDSTKNKLSQLRRNHNRKRRVMDKNEDGTDSSENFRVSPAKAILHECPLTPGADKPDISKGDWYNHQVGKNKILYHTHRGVLKLLKRYDKK